MAETLEEVDRRYGGVRRYLDQVDLDSLVLRLRGASPDGQ
jgi:hypothetical protein